MHLTSSAFEAGQEIPAQYTCDGQGMSPPLLIGDVSPGTKSLALLLNDPDAPGGNFVHWIVWNIPPQTTEIVAGKLPAGAQTGRNSAGTNEYFPPCPPSGSHRYVFTLFAFDTVLNLPSSAAERDIREAHALAQIQLSGTYRRR
jgi:Raf kinase inhibitor-like YbhB/YbcL family protein